MGVGLVSKTLPAYCPYSHEGRLPFRVILGRSCDGVKRLVPAFVVHLQVLYKLKIPLQFLKMTQMVEYIEVYNRIPHLSNTCNPNFW